MNHWDNMSIYQEMTEFPSELKGRESISGNCREFWSCLSSEESAITLINKGYISLRKGGDNVLASSSKCFSFQSDTLQSCLGSAWADCASSTHFPVGILTWYKGWWLHCSTGGAQEDREDNLSLGRRGNCEITYIKAEFPSRYFINTLTTSTASQCTLST